MESFIVQDGQTLLDISLQLYGSLSYLVKICVDNNIDINSDLIGGDIILYDIELSNLSPIPNQLRLSNTILNTSSELMYNTQEPLPEMLEHSPEEYTNEEHN